MKSTTLRPTRVQLKIAGVVVAAFAIVVAVFWQRAESGPQAPTGPDAETARLVKHYFATNDKTSLAQAAAALGSALAAPESASPTHRALLAEVVVCAQGQLPLEQRTHLDPLYRAVVRVLAADHCRLGRLALDDIFYPQKVGSLLSEATYARELIACANPNRLGLLSADEIIAFIGIKPGDTVADVGSGPGFWTFHFARAVGDKGRSIAIEINPYILAFLRQYIADQGIRNVEIVRGADEDVRLPQGSVDHAWMTHMFVDIEAYYPLEHRQKLFGSVLRSLKHGGDFTVCEPPGIITPDLNAKQIAERLTAYGFEFVAHPPAGSALARSHNCVRARRP